MFTLPTPIFNVLFYTMIVLSMVVFIHLAFYTIVALFGLKKPQRTYTIKPDDKKFLFMIPAHNEAAVIGNCIESLKSLEYDDTLYDAVVLADHCTDDTAVIAEGFEGIKVFRNTYKPGESRGKPHVIARYIKKF